MRRAVSSFSALPQFAQLPVQRQFSPLGVPEGRPVLAEHFREDLFRLFGEDMRRLAEARVCAEHRQPRRMADSYSRVALGLSQARARSKYLNHSGSVRLGRLLEVGADTTGGCWTVSTT